MIFIIIIIIMMIVIIILNMIIIIIISIIVIIIIIKILVQARTVTGGKKRKVRVKEPISVSPALQSLFDTTGVITARDVELIRCWWERSRRRLNKRYSRLISYHHKVN
jgi:hypothetical protein